MRKRVPLFFFFFILTGALFIFYPFWTLSLSLADKIILLKVVHPGDTFHLRYLHSIALSDVWESFLIDPEHRILLTETRFQGQGAGLPYHLSPGEHLVCEGRWFHITGMKRMVPSIHWRIQKDWHDRFRFGDGPEVDFSAQVGDGLIHIQLRKLNLLRWLQYTCIPGIIKKS
jgi:hypothetical protein